MKNKRLVLLILFLTLGTASETFALRLKIATLAPAGTTWMKEMKKGATAIKAKTDGRVQIKFYPGGVMGNDQSVHRKIRINQLQGGAFSATGLAHIDSSIQTLSMPMLFRSFAEVDYVRKVMDERIKTHMADNGFIILGLTEGGFGRIMSSRNVESLQLIRDTKVWIPEGDRLIQNLFKTMGIEPIPLPISDVFTGLQTGLIETIASSSTGAIAFQWHSKVTHMVDIPVLYLIGVLAVSEKAFKRINPDDQRIVIDEMNAVFSILDKVNRKDNIEATNVLKSLNIKIIKPAPDEIATWQGFSDQSTQSLVSSGKIDKSIMQEIHALLVEYRNR